MTGMLEDDRSEFARQFESFRTGCQNGRDEAESENGDSA